MLKPYTQLEEGVLDALLDEYLTCDDGGDNLSISQRKEKLMKLLKAGEVFVIYPPDDSPPCLIPKQQVPAEELSKYRQLLRDLESDVDESQADEPHVAACESSEDSDPDPDSDPDFDLELELAPHLLESRLEVLKASIRFPFDLGRTLMTSGVKALLDSGKVALEDLQGLLLRHSNGDFGELSIESRWANLEAVGTEHQVNSWYPLAGTRLLVQTELGHTQTMVMLESES